MSNKRETTEGRLNRQLRNQKAILDRYDELETQSVKLDNVDKYKRYKAARSYNRAMRKLQAIRDRQLAAYYRNIQKETA